MTRTRFLNKICTIDDANAALKNFMPQQQTTDWTFALEQMEELMLALDNPQEKVKMIHVAGTSGKTSTCYYIAGMLRRTGKTVGLTVSPHVDSIRERVQVNGEALPEAEFCQLLDEFLNLPALKATKPSYFGVMVAFAYWVFARKNVDYGVIEVGLGGRLDATNIIKNSNKVSVVTDIGLDHTDMLGHTTVAIAGEKAEIIKPQNHVYVALQDQDVMKVFKDKAASVDAQITIVDQVVEAPTDLPQFQQRNWSLAYRAVDYVAQRDDLDFSLEKAKESAATYIPARMEVVQHDPQLIIMDGAHNAQKFTALCSSLQAKYADQKIAAVISITHGKDESIDKKMKALKPVVDHLIITTFHSNQDVPKWSVEPKIIQDAAKAAGFSSVEVIDKPQAAFEALKARPEPILLITGSFYLLNHIRPLVSAQKA